MEAARLDQRLYLRVADRIWRTARPIAGILIADYWLVRKTRLAVDDLFNPNGRYRYRGGWNPIALVALAAGALPNVPGFLHAAAPVAFGWIGGFWTRLYDYAWFVGLIVALIVYRLGMRTPAPEAA